MTDATFNISIPSDSDGLISLQCTLCGEYSKLTPKNLEGESQLYVWCPKCGLTPDSSFIDEIIELAMKIVGNHVSGLLNNLGKSLNKSLKNGSVKFKSGSRIRKNPVDPIILRLDNLELQIYDCCHKEAKVSPNLKMEGRCYPFYGEMQGGD